MKYKTPLRIFSTITFAVFAAVLFFVGVQSAFATVTITAATGGSTISADTNTANGTATWTTLTGPTILETTFQSFSGPRTFILAFSSGFSFNTSYRRHGHDHEDRGHGNLFYVYLDQRQRPPRAL